MIGGPIIDFVNLFGLAWLGGTIGVEGIARFLIWIIFFALFQGVLTSRVSPSFIGGKKRIASVLSLALSLLVAIGIPKQLEEELLAHVLRDMAVAEDAVGEPVGGTLVGLQQLLERLHVPGSHPGHQLLSRCCCRHVVPLI